MAFLDDFEDAVHGYPAASVTISIVNLAPITPSTPNGVNVNDIWAFNVRVRNRGNLNMTGVALNVAGMNGALVSTSATGPWLPSISCFGSLNVGGHIGQQDTPNLFFKAPGTPKDSDTQLISANICAFDVDLNHILIDHTGSSATPTGDYKTQVFP